MLRSLGACLLLEVSEQAAGIYRGVVERGELAGGGEAVPREHPALSNCGWEPIARQIRIPNDEIRMKSQ